MKLILCLIILGIPWFVAFINANYEGEENEDTNSL